MVMLQHKHGGQESTILALYNTMHHWGAIVATPGYTDKVLYGTGGNPYGTSVSVDDKTGEMKEDVKSAVYQQAKRTVEIATMLKIGSSRHKTVET
jgi:NAD(P)H dehydrogenase (quinone)